MISLKYRFKNNKKLLILAIIVLVTAVFDLFVFAFDITQFVAVSKNSTNRFAGFETLNIFAGLLSVFAIVSILIYIILARRKIKIDISLNGKRH